MPPTAQAPSASSATASTSAPSSKGASGRELWPALLALVIGVPLVFMFTRAMSDSEARRREAPLRALLGDETFDKLSKGERTPEHYYGDSLLAPDFELVDQHGKKFHLKEVRGKAVVLNFWSITCQPCVEEMPSVVELARMALTRDDLIVASISTDKGWDDVKTIMPPDSPLRVMFDPDRKVVSGKFGTRLYPETWVIDKHGVIRLRIDGGRNWSDALTMDAIERVL